MNTRIRELRRERRISQEELARGGHDAADDYVHRGGQVRRVAAAGVQDCALFRADDRGSFRLFGGGMMVVRDYASSLNGRT